MSAKSVLVRKNRQTFRAHKPKATSGMELPTKSGEGERVAIELAQIQSCAGSFRHAIACHLPPGGRLFTFRIIYKKDRERQASSVLLSVGNVFYSVCRTVLKGTALFFVPFLPFIIQISSLQFPCFFLRSSKRYGLRFPLFQRYRAFHPLL